VLPEERTPRRQVERHEGLFLRSHPLRDWELRRWLASPSVGPAADGPAPAPAGLMFLPTADDTRAKRKLGPRKRIRVVSNAIKQLESGLDRSKVSTTTGPIGN